MQTRRQVRLQAENGFRSGVANSSNKKRKLTTTVKEEQEQEQEPNQEEINRLVKLFSTIDTVLVYMTSSYRSNKNPLFNLHQVKINVERSCRYNLSIGLVERIIDIYPQAYKIERICLRGGGGGENKNYKKLSSSDNNKENLDEMNMLIGLPQGTLPDTKYRLDEFTARLKKCIMKGKTKPVMVLKDNENGKRAAAAAAATPRLSMIMNRPKSAGTSCISSSKSKANSGCYSSLVERIRAKEKILSSSVKDNENIQPQFKLLNQCQEIVVPILQNIHNEEYAKTTHMNNRIMQSLDQLSFKISKSCINRLTHSQAKECLLFLSREYSWINIINVDDINAVELCGKISIL